MIVPKYPLNTSNATLWIEYDWKYRSQSSHVLFLQSRLHFFLKILHVALN